MDIIPKYEVLYNDLIELGIGSFLTSRRFKIFLSNVAKDKIWNKVQKYVKDNSDFYSVDLDMDEVYAEDTLKSFFNLINQSQQYENIIALIIEEFIKRREEKTDLSNLMESAGVTALAPINYSIIEEAIMKHHKKEFSLPTDKSNELKNQQELPINMSNEIFIVHGHDKALLTDVARTLEHQNLVPVILSEQTNKGNTIIEKFERHSKVPYAIVLLTNDDFGNSKGAKNKKKRARQNVILELGYFMAKLGRKGVLILYERDVELPTDILGIAYIEIDESGFWKNSMIKELKEAGFDVDANKIR